MNGHLTTASIAMAHSPLFGITLTLAAYELARSAWRRTNHNPLVNPVLVAIILVAATLLIAHIPYRNYLDGAQYISFLLGPATVALAVPLHRQAAHIRRAALPILTCAIIGAATAIITGIAVTRALGGGNALALSMAPKSATTPVAIALAQTIGGWPELTAVLTILTGVLGAVAAPAWLNILRIRDEQVRGFSIGMSSHGIGTTRAFHESSIAGAFSALAMALNALTTAIALPLILALMPAILRPWT